MWCTLQVDGKILLHSGDDPLRDVAHSETISDSAVDQCENLWDIAGLVRLNGLKICKLELMLNL